jgi:hypothetical protein
MDNKTNIVNDDTDITTNNLSKHRIIRRNVTEEHKDKRLKYKEHFNRLSDFNNEGGILSKINDISRSGYNKTPKLQSNSDVDIIHLQNHVECMKITNNLPLNLSNNYIDIPDHIFIRNIPNKMPISKVKNIIWNKYNPGNPDVGKCFCCDKIITLSETDVEFGHVYPEKPPSEYVNIYSKVISGDYTEENIRPLCRKCNRGRGGMHQKHMYLYMIDNDMIGLKNLEPYQKIRWLYTSDRSIKIKECVDKIDTLYMRELIRSSHKQILLSSLEPDNYTNDKLICNVVSYILSI